MKNQKKLLRHYVPTRADKKEQTLFKNANTRALSRCIGVTKNGQLMSTMTRQCYEETFNFIT